MPVSFRIVVKLVVWVLRLSIFGFEAGQDGLHVFKRLLLCIDLSSVEAAWGVRCLRKMLGSWNPTTRAGSTSEQHEDERDEMEYRDGRFPPAGGNVAGGGAGGVGSPEAGARTSGARKRAGARQLAQRSSLVSVLGAYFDCERLPDDAFDVLSVSVMHKWEHPHHGKCAPPCAKAVILDEAARLTAMRGQTQRECAAAAYKLVYPEFPSVRSIREDMHGLRIFLGVDGVNVSSRPILPGPAALTQSLQPP